MHSFGAPRASRAGGWDVFVTLVSLADARLAPDCALARWQAMAVQQEQQMAAQQPQYNHFLVCGNQFCVDAKYTPLKPLGKGAYGVVCSARDVRSGECMAIKKISSAFANTVDAKRTLREIRLLKRMRHDNVVALKDVMKPPGGRATYSDVYVAYELMDTDLHQIIRSTQVLSEDHCQYFIYQLLRGLKYVHSASVLHRDLKPSNLLVNANCDLKIADFGLARALARSSTESNAGMTEYVVTRWYRAPELLLSCAEYSPAIDVWSVGCILAELLMRRPLFPGKDYVHQIHLITALTGVPQEEEMTFVRNERARAYILAMPPQRGVSMRSLAPDAPALACDLVDRCLAFDPAKRITVDQALKHPFLASLHDEADEPVAAFVVGTDADADIAAAAAAGGPGSVEASLREGVYREILAFHPEVAEADRVFDQKREQMAQMQMQSAQQQQHDAAMAFAMAATGAIPVAHDLGGDHEHECTDSDFLPTPGEMVMSPMDALTTCQSAVR